MISLCPEKQSFPWPSAVALQATPGLRVNLLHPLKLQRKRLEKKKCLSLLVSTPCWALSFNTLRIKLKTHQLTAMLPAHTEW